MRDTEGVENSGRVSRSVDQRRSQIEARRMRNALCPSTRIAPVLITGSLITIY